MIKKALFKEQIAPFTEKGTRILLYIESNVCWYGLFFYLDTHYKKEIIFFFGGEFLSKFWHIPPEEPAKFTACLQKEWPFS